MPNVNSQTIYQMGSLVNDVVKQATGRDPVQSIEMSNVTVAQNTLLGIETLSGSVVRFRTPKSVPLLSLEAQIVAQQNLHGYDYPWPTGGGVNILPNFTINGTMSDVAVTTENDIITLNGTASAYGQQLATTTFFLPAGDYYFYQFDTGSNAPISQLRSADGTIVYASSVNNSFTLADTAEIKLRVTYSNGQTFDNYSIRLMLVKGTSAPTAYTPYSNICPITGFTGCNITVSDGDTTEHVYPVEWETEAGTVYGGVLDAKNGKLTVDKVSINVDPNDLTNNGSTPDGIYLAFYRINNRKPNKNIICNYFPESSVASNAKSWLFARTNSGAVEFHLSFDLIGVTSDDNDNTVKLPAARTWFTNNTVQLVYELAEPVEYEVTPVAINTLAGDNVVSANTGDISLSYYVYSDLL